MRPLSDPILLIDVGNTNIKLGLADARGLGESYSLPTDQRATADGFGLQAVQLCRLSGVEPAELRAVAVSSVAPGLDRIVSGACKRFLDLTPRFIGRDLPIALENRYANAGEVGADRLATAFATTRLFTAESYVVIDFGTATTFDCALPGAYLGGLICPGLLSSAQALFAGTAKLPQADFDVAPGGPVVGRSTRDSLNHGLAYGFAAMVEGLVARLSAQLPGRTLVIGTGGFCEPIMKLTDAIHESRPDLLLEGLRLAILDQETDRPGRTPAAGPTDNA
jgi:type III pantothenate kinase